MVEFIGNETKKILFKACERYAKSNGKKLDELQLILSLNLIETESGELGVNEDELNKFTICENYKPKADLTIWEVLNVRPKLDFLGYSRLAPPFIFKSLIRFSEKYSINLDEVKILCQPFINENKKSDMQLALYNGYEYLKEIKFYPEEDENGDIDYSFEYLFNQQDAEMPKL